MKIKSEIIRFIEQEQEITEEPIETPIIGDVEIVERIPPQRQVTLKELLDEVEKVIKIAERKRTKETEVKEIEVFEIKINALDIEQKMQEVIKFIDTNPIEFYQLIKRMGKNNKEEKVAVFLALLHLFQKKQVLLEQKQVFGELYVMKNEKNN